MLAIPRYDMIHAYALAHTSLRLRSAAKAKMLAMVYLNTGSLVPHVYRLVTVDEDVSFFGGNRGIPGPR